MALGSCRLAGEEADKGGYDRMCVQLLHFLAPGVAGK